MEKFQVFIINEDQSKSLIREYFSEEEAFIYINKSEGPEVYSLECKNDLGSRIIF